MQCPQIEKGKGWVQTTVIQSGHFASAPLSMVDTPSLAGAKDALFIQLVRHQSYLAPWTATDSHGALRFLELFELVIRCHKSHNPAVISRTSDLGERPCLSSATWLVRYRQILRWFLVSWISHHWSTQFQKRMLISNLSKDLLPWCVWGVKSRSCMHQQSGPLLLAVVSWSMWGACLNLY